MIRPKTYEGSEPYIFVSYAHKDSDRVLPIISALQEQGFRVWYDAGIEAGSEWPEYIAEHLLRATCVIAFITKASLDSHNCYREINFAISRRKDLLTVYLEDVTLSPGMEMQLGTLQALYACRHSSQESFLEELCHSRVLSPCRGAALSTSATPKVSQTPKRPVASVPRISPEEACRKGDEYFDKKEYKEAVSWYRKSANQGNAEAQYKVGICYENGLGFINSDIVEAAKWYHKSAEKGYADALTKLASLPKWLLEQLHVPQSLVPATPQPAPQQTAAPTVKDTPAPHTAAPAARKPDLQAIGAPSVHRQTVDHPQNTAPLNPQPAPQQVVWPAVKKSPAAPAARKPDLQAIDALFEYEQSSDGNIRITKLKDKNSATVEIPWGVTDIGKRIFSLNDSLTKVIVPNSVTVISNEAFCFCSNLTSITIPNSVTSIGDSAFCHCSSLTSITIPNSVTSIGDRAFSGCYSLTNISIPNSVTSIGDRAFSWCRSLTNISIPNSVTNIGIAAFECCGSLTDVTIPNSVTAIGSGAFSYCNKLAKYIVPENHPGFCSLNGVLFTKNREKFLAYPAGKPDTTYTIPDGVVSIGNFAFGGCHNLTSITIPNCVTSIGNYAFHVCRSLSSVTIPDSVTSISKSAFSGCSSLTSITIPNSVTTIDWHAFDGCAGLTSITIPDSVTGIGASAFLDCNSLTSITIPDSVTSIGDDAFKGCKKLTIYGKRGSAAARYARKHFIRFKAI